MAHLAIVGSVARERRLGAAQPHPEGAPVPRLRRDVARASSATRPTASRRGAGFASAIRRSRRSSPRSIGEGWVTDLPQLARSRRRRRPAAARRVHARQARQQGALGGIRREDERNHLVAERALRRAGQADPRVQAPALANPPRRPPPPARAARGELRVPRVVLLAGKAAPGYDMAKRIIHLANDVAATMNRDDRTRERINLVFLPNYSRLARGARHPGGRSLRAGVHRRDGGFGHGEHEARAQRGAHHRDARRREHRDPRRGRARRTSSSSV